MRVRFHIRALRGATAFLAAATLASVVCFPVLAALAKNGDCSIPVTNGNKPTASDCLFILRVAVNIGDCVPCICDTNGNTLITAADALLCLRFAVASAGTLACPACPETTTTTEIAPTTTIEPPTTTLPETTTTLPETTTTLPETTTTLPDTTTTLPDTTTTTLPDTTTTTTPPTTTLPEPTTTTTEPPTTTLPPSGACPVSAEWITRAAYGEPCAKNSDCDAGTCDGTSGRCHTLTDFDLGWTGNGHESDLLDGTLLRASIECAAGEAPCGECAIGGIEPAAGSCRCANNFRAHCDEAFELDADDCPACFAGAFVGNACTNNTDCMAGNCERRCANNLSVVCDQNQDCPGSTCNTQQKCSNGKNCNFDADCSGTCTSTSRCQCYDAPPLSLTIGGTPFCVIQRMEADLAGTVNVDSGATDLVRKLAMLVYSGESVVAPCPLCGGTCSDAPATLCVFDQDCGTGGSCELDETAGDGLRGGTCTGGRSIGQSCDIEARNPSLPPVPAGSSAAGVSLDCAPNQSISGSGLALTLVESTSDSFLPATLSCGGAFSELDCPCLICSLSSITPCRSDADCAPDKGTCSALGNGSAQPNACEDFLCAGSGDDATCTTGPDDRFCDGFVRADGRGIVTCLSDADCDAFLPGSGDCTIVQRRSCFAYPIVADGEAHPRRPVTAANFCLGTTSTAGRNAAIGLPGAGRVTRQNTLRSICANGQGYVPGSGGCPP